MRPILCLVLLSHPAPVTSIGGDRNPDGTITVTWTLPADPSVVGVTVERERLDESDDLVVFVLNGAPVSLTDTTAEGNGSYRYWVYTRNASNEFSTGAFLEVISPSDLDDDHWECFVAGSVGPPPWAFALGALAAAAGLALIRGR
jgi:hypothetical protein